MDIKYLKSLVKLLDESNLNELEIEEEGGRIYLSKSGQGELISHQPVAMAPQAHTQAPVMPASPAPTADSKTEESNSAGHTYHEITSPIVGTFYEAPSPESPKFVNIGDRVEVGQTLCIVEAMKVMNEIESDMSGVVEKVLVSNASPVEYGEPMFWIKPD